MSRGVPEAARGLAAQLERQFARDAELAKRLAGAQERLSRANDRLWWGLHPDGLAAVYGEDPAAVDVAFAENRSEVLAAPDPLRAAQQLHWMLCLHCTLILSRLVIRSRSVRQSLYLLSFIIVRRACLR